jgi:hypothetical protein
VAASATSSLNAVAEARSTAAPALVRASFNAGDNIAIIPA